MKTHFAFIPLCILFAFSFSVKMYAQETLITSAGGEDTYVLTNTIKKIDKNIKEVWIKIKLSDENTDYYRQKRIEYMQLHNISTVGYEKYSYTKVKRRYDCFNRKFTPIRESVFGIDNKLIDQGDFEPNSWFSIVPNTPSEKIFNCICK